MRLLDLKRILTGARVLLSRRRVARVLAAAARLVRSVALVQAPLRGFAGFCCSLRCRGRGAAALSIGGSPVSDSSLPKLPRLRLSRDGILPAFSFRNVGLGADMRILQRILREPILNHAKTGRSVRRRPDSLSIVVPKPHSYVAACARKGRVAVEKTLNGSPDVAVGSVNSRQL